MTVQKLTYPSKENAVQEKINEIIDNLGGGGSVDNITISQNSSNQLQAIGLINKNTATGTTNPKYDWVGTLQEYETQQIETNHPEWICYIIDDVSGGTSVYTKTQVDALISAITVSWGSVTGTLSDQTDLQNALNSKANTSQFQVVSSLPASPDVNTFYFIPES